MPAIEKNPSRLLQGGYHLENKSVLSDNYTVAAFEAKLRVLEEPERPWHIQSLRELWQVMKDVLKETRKAQAERKAQASAATETPSGPSLTHS